MPYFWDTTPGTLPRPDLNPLANPALERNLNRWAQAYFSNPPGKREEAISKLLQEIKNETSEILIAERARREASARSAAVKSAEIRSAETRSAASQDVSCPICQHRNPPEHQFCGQCGGGLDPVQSGPRGHSVLADIRPPGDEPPPQPDGEVQWLRDRALGHLYEVEAPAWRGWKYVLAGLAIALAGFAYMQWDLSRPNRVVSGAIAPAKRVTNPASPVPAADKASSAAGQRPSETISSLPNASVPNPSSPNPSSPNPSVPRVSDPKLSEVRSVVSTPPAQIVQGRKTGRTELQPAAQKSALLAAPPIPMAVDGGGTGSADLRLAQRYLGGSMGARDSSEAAKLLWRAVAKQNTTAAILLSGLYARGDGVPKSCDQARLLLVAATKHGASQAAEQLRDLERRGCQ